MEIKKRFIAFIDILGFRDIINKNTLQDIDRLLKIIPYSLNQIKSDKVLEQNYPNIQIKSSVFSDTIILFTENDESISLDKLLISTSFLIRNALQENLVLKGSISYGDVAIDETNNLFYGQPIIDAYLLEQEVSYIGVVIHNSVEKYIKDINYHDLISTGKLIEFPTPLKSGIIEHLNLNWLKLTNNYPTNKSNIIEKIKEIRMTCSASPRKYYDNTIKIIDNFYPKE